MLDTYDTHSPNHPANQLEVQLPEEQKRDVKDLLYEVEEKIEHLKDYFSTMDNSYVLNKLNEITNILR